MKHLLSITDERRKLIFTQTAAQLVLPLTLNGFVLSDYLDSVF